MTALSPSDTRKHRLLLVVLAGAMLLDSLEVSMLATALPSIAGEFTASPAAAQWALTGFAFGFGAALLPARSLIHRLGRRRTYLAALGTFAVAAALSGVASGIPELALAELVKGACAAVTAPLGMAVIATTFPDRRRAALTFSLIGTAGAPIGLLLAGFAAQLSWRLAVSVTAVAAVALILLALRTLPADPDARPPTPSTRSLRTPSLLRAALTAAAFNGASIGLFVLANFELQHRFGWQPWQVALVFLPAYGVLPLSVLAAPSLMARRGPALPITVGAALAVAACLLYPTLGPLPSAIALGLAYVALFAPVNASATVGLPPADQPLGALTVQTAVQFGAVLVMPAIGGLISTSDGSGPATLLVTAVAVVAAIAAATGLRPANREKGTP